MCESLWAGRLMMKQNEISVIDRKQAKRGLEYWLWWRCAYWKYSARGVKKDESRDWMEDGGVTGQKKEHGFTPRTHSQKHSILNEKEAACRAEQKWKTPKQRLERNLWARRLTWSCSHHAEIWKTGQELLRFAPGGSWKGFKDGRDNQIKLQWCLLSKKSYLAQSETFSRKTIQHTNGDVNGPIILPPAATKEKLPKCNLIVGGTHSVNRVCYFNPAWYGKCIHLNRRGDWQLAQVPYGLRWRQRRWNNTAGALIKATSYFHHHASEDICIAALPKGTLTQQAGLPQHQHNETGCKSACVCAREGTHTAFPSPSSQGWGENTEGLSLMGMQMRRYSFRGLHRGNLQREIFTGYSWGWMEFSCKLEAFSAKRRSTERMITFLRRASFHSPRCGCKICSFSAESSHSVTALI